MTMVIREGLRYSMVVLVQGFAVVVVRLLRSVVLVVVVLSCLFLEHDVSALAWSYNNNTKSMHIQYMQ